LRNHWPGSVIRWAQPARWRKLWSPYCEYHDSSISLDSRSNTLDR
jgi:hypothetical protein